MKLLRIALMTLAWLAGAALCVQAADSKTPPFRFLILIDSSSNMRRLEQITPTLVYDLITDGLYGRMQPGDVYGVWSFSEEVDTAFSPPLVWRPELARSQAQAIDQQIRRIKYKGKAKLEEAIAKVKPIALQSDDLTIFILHDGSGVMFGTPFDLQITAIYKQFYKDMVKNERPFITGLAVQNRKLIAWSVDAAGGAPTIPYFPRHPRPGETPATNKVAKAVKPAEPAPEPPPKKPVPPIIVKGPLKPAPSATNTPVAVATKPEATTPKPETPKPVEPPPKATPVAPTEPKPVMTQSPPPKVVAPLVNETALPSPIATAPSPAPPVTIPAPAPREAITEPVATIAAAHPDGPVKASDIVHLKLEPEKAETKTPPPQSTPEKATPPSTAPKTSPATEVAAKSVNSAAQLAQTAIVTPPSGGPDWLKISLGIFCFVGAIAAIFFLTRRNQIAAHGSVISRSMNKDR